MYVRYHKEWQWWQGTVWWNVKNLHWPTFCFLSFSSVSTPLRQKPLLSNVKGTSLSSYSTPQQHLGTPHLSTPPFLKYFPLLASATPLSCKHHSLTGCYFSGSWTGSFSSIWFQDPKLLFSVLTLSDLIQGFKYHYYANESPVVISSPPFFPKPKIHI